MQCDQFASFAPHAALASKQFQVVFMCYMLFDTARAQRLILHAGNILINLEDDRVSVDDSCTLICNEVIELHEEQRGSKRVST